MPSRPLSQTVDVETPELVVLSYTIAGVGSRALAALVDYLICLVAMIALLVLVAMVMATGLVRVASSTAWVMALLVVGQFAVLWGYYVLFEGLADGQTPGKRWLRLRVVRDGGYSVTFGASAVRNLVRIVDMQPLFFYGVGVVSIVATRAGKRLGDIVAGTVVVRESLVSAPAIVGAAPAADGALAGPPAQAALTDDEFAVLAQFAGRRGTLPAERRAVLVARLADRLRPHLDAAERYASGTGTMVGGGSDAGRLVALYEAERRARAQGATSMRETGAARERHAIVATGSARWAAFGARLARAQRGGGLRSLGEEGVREFVREYRDLTADLARLRTAARGRESPELFYLGRLVAGAHNLLYRGRSLTVLDALRLIAVEAPREVRRSARPILLAAAMLWGPAAIAYTAVVQRPAVARVFVPPPMLDRAEEGVQRAREGLGYIPDPQLFRPVMASAIIANNVQVTFMAFALGITAGVGTTLLLVVNGISLGGVFGLYASKGIAPLLLAFVAPHGVLELTAVCIAGGAGLLLAAALLLPGRRTRRRALVENGRRAIRLVAASSVLLLFAGTLEGFVSPIAWWPLEAKLALSGLTAVLLVAYLRGGRERSTPMPAPAEPPAPGELLGLGEG